MGELKASPIFYMGNKYKLLKYILPLFPEKCNLFLDAFGGSGVVSLNYKGSNRIIYNEINPNVIGLIKMIQDNDIDELDKYYKTKIETYNLRTKSNKNNPLENAEGYYQLRNEYNQSADKNYKDLFLLLCYSMNHLMRFNTNNEFNASNGADAYNEKNYELLMNFKQIFSNIRIVNKDIFELHIDKLSQDDFVYFDPPYLNTTAVYNEKRAYGGWNIESDYRLFELCEKLNSKGIKWALSNVFENRGKKNEHLIAWCEKNNWNVTHLNRNYNPFSRGNSNNDEVLIKNY